MPLHVSNTCAHHQDVKIALHSLWYHHTYRWPSRARDDHLNKYTEMHGQQNVKICSYMFRSTTIIREHSLEPS